MKEFNVEDVVLIYKNTPTFTDGTIAQVIDRDPNDNSYAVADLRDIGKADKDIGIILNRYAKWVKPDDMVKLSFDKPKPESKFKVVMTVFYYVLCILVGVLGGKLLTEFTR